jgi:hypothetical protein
MLAEYEPSPRSDTLDVAVTSVLDRTIQLDMRLLTGSPNLVKWARLAN